MTDFYAHTRDDKECDFIQHQTLEDHVKHAASYASDYLSGMGLRDVGFLAGICHDAGKYKMEYQNYLLSEDKKRGSVNHSFAGCRLLLEKFHGDRVESYEDLTAEILAYAVGAHHGLFDCVSIDHELGFYYRQTKDGIFYEESCRNFLSECLAEEVLRQRFQEAHEELSAVYERLSTVSRRNGGFNKEEFEFYLGALARLVLSAVIAGDRRDTAEFMEGVLFADVQKSCTSLWQERLDFMENKLNMKPQETAIEEARMAISEQCRLAAEHEKGIFRLNVPTGSGKTLSALRFALAQAKKWNCKRIIFAAPLLTIIDQNAKAIRDYVGDDSIILEHHSNVVDSLENSDDLKEWELAAERWEEPIIITTMVQLLQTMFSGKTTSIRRFHTLTNAVIVLDEVQSVPNDKLSLFNSMVNFLSTVCGTTFLLCSATQPCFEETKHPMLDCVKDVVPYSSSLWSAFERTVITDAGRMTLADIPDFAVGLLNETDSLLIICNTKKEAEYLFHALEDKAEHVFHLSASMCMAHRKEKLASLEALLKHRHEKIICVATQVIEAGVDISFNCVIRLAAGLDSIIQSAGRCNRHGESKEPVPVYVIQCADEQLGLLKDIKRGKEATLSLLAQYKKSPKNFSYSLSSDQAIRWYYRKLYTNIMTEGANIQDGNIKIGKEVVTLYSLLSDNNKYLDETLQGKYCLNQAFALAGKSFQVFDESTTDIVVPYGDGKVLIEELTQEWQPTVAFMRKWQQRAKLYTISIYEHQKRALGYLLNDIHGVFVLSEDAYDEQLGLVVNNELAYMEA